MGSISILQQEAAIMKKKLGRLLQPSVGAYFVYLLIFAVLAALMQYYMLAVVELLVTAVLFTIYLLFRKNRRNQIQKYLDKELEETALTNGAKPPFPLLVVRLADGGVVYANDPFIQLTGFQDTLTERTMEEVLPGFNTEWLSAGKSEYPYDLTLHNHRYRVYGTALRADDAYATRLGVLYFSDLTELC